jgi:hypothetical protein
MGLVGSGLAGASRQIGAGEVAPEQMRELPAPAKADENKPET